MWWDLTELQRSLLPGPQEQFRDYARRISPLLPNFPEECLRQWIFDHGANAFRFWGWLDLHKTYFHQETWSTADVVSQVASTNEVAIENWKTLLGSNAEFSASRLGSYMIQEGTWPVAPIVLDTSSTLGLPDGTKLCRYHLVEGHHRLAYIRALHENKNWRPQDQHRLWVMVLAEEEYKITRQRSIA